MTVADGSGNDRVNGTAAASGATTHNLSATHPDTVPAAPVLGDLIAANGTPAWARLAGNTTVTQKFLRQTRTGTASDAPAWDTLLAADRPAHTHAESDVTSLATDLTNRPVKGGAWAVSKAAVINSSGQLDGAAGTVTDCVLVNGSSAAKANASHTHAATDIISGTIDNAGTSGTANATASTLVLRDGLGGASFAYVAANNQWAYLDSHFQSFECGGFQTVGGPFENMAKYTEDFTAATWDKNRGSCSATANSTAAPDGNTTADTITAVTATPIIQQQVRAWRPQASTRSMCGPRSRPEPSRFPSPSWTTPMRATSRARRASHSRPPDSGSRSPERSRVGRPDSGSSCASSPRTATTGQVAPSTCGERACSRATIPRVDTPARGCRRPPLSRPEWRAARQ